MYILKASGLCIPVQGELGEQQVINRAINLLSEFGDLQVFKQNDKGNFLRLTYFANLKQERLSAYYRSRHFSY